MTANVYCQLCYPRGREDHSFSFHFPLCSQCIVSVNYVPGIILCAMDMALSNLGRGLLLASFGMLLNIP